MKISQYYTITSILDPSNLSQTPDISSWLSNQFVLYVVNLRQIYPKPLFYPQIPNDRSEYKIEVIVYIDVRKGVLGGLTRPLRLKIWTAPPPLENFRAGDPLKHLLGGLGGR